MGDKCYEAREKELMEPWSLECGGLAIVNRPFRGGFFGNDAYTKTFE